MRSRRVLCSKRWRGLARIPAVAALGGMLLSQAVPPLSYAAGSNDNNTTTPIKHVIFIIGENRTFDHLFGTYKPGGGQQIWNLLSRKLSTRMGNQGRTLISRSNTRRTTHTRNSIRTVSLGLSSSQRSAA